MARVSFGVVVTRGQITTLDSLTTRPFFRTTSQPLLIPSILTTFSRLSLPHHSHPQLFRQNNNATGALPQHRCRTRQFNHHRSTSTSTWGVTGPRARAATRAKLPLSPTLRSSTTSPKQARRRLPALQVSLFSAFRSPRVCMANENTSLKFPLFCSRCRSVFRRCRSSTERGRQLPRALRHHQPHPRVEPRLRK